MVSVSETAASSANRSRISARSASLLNASTMKACAVLLAAPASRAIRRLRPSGSLRLVADMDDALHHWVVKKYYRHGSKSSYSSEEVKRRTNIALTALVAVGLCIPVVQYWRDQTLTKLP